MITEDYVSFEVAKLLKEKGFDELCIFKYSSEGVRMKAGVAIDEWQNSELDDDECSCPSQSMAMKWLREVHNIFIVIEPHMYDYINEKNLSCIASLWQGDNYYEKITSKDYPAYEEAVEAALKYSLENFIY